MSLHRQFAGFAAVLALGLGLAALADPARESTDLDSVRRSTPRPLESMAGPDSAAHEETAAKPAAPPASANPDAQSSGARDDAGAGAALARAKDRLDRANAAYSEMQARHYPRGDARAKIVQERDEAQREYQRLLQGSEGYQGPGASDEEDQD
jgi:hypothetical protein